MAMANLVWKTSWMTVAPQPTKQSTSRFKKSYYTPPTSSSKLHASYASRHLPLMHVVKPNSMILKENTSFAENMNFNDCFGSNSFVFWKDLKHNDNKLKCNWKKKDAVANAEDDKRMKETRRSESNRSRFYATVVGASFCVFLGLCSVSLPKLIRPSNYMEVPYSDLVGGIRDGSVERVQFVENSREIYFNPKSLGDEIVQTPETDSLATRLGEVAKIFNPKWQYRTRNVEDDRYELLKILKENEITYGSNRELISASMKNFLLIFFQVAPFWIMVLLSCYQLNINHDLGKITKRKPNKRQSVTFDDVKGVDAAKAELLEIVLCMKGDNKYMKLGAKLPKGVLLTGPPGTGKTLLARAVAGEAKVSFFSISASELVEVFVGRGAARVRDLFREARKNSPSIIFIDEIDAVGGQRGRTLNCERDQTLNQLLTELDGFEKAASVVVIAATNRPETLDSALMRPGRFSRKVQVNVPDESGRREIFGLYLRDVPMEADKKETISQFVASVTPGLVGADLENIARESVLLAARRGGEFVTEGDIFQAVDRARAKFHEEKPFSFEPTTQDHAYGSSMGFGFSN